MNDTFFFSVGGVSIAVRLPFAYTPCPRERKFISAPCSPDFEIEVITTDSFSRPSVKPLVNEPSTDVYLSGDTYSCFRRHKSFPSGDFTDYCMQSFSVDPADCRRQRVYINDTTAALCEKTGAVFHLFNLENLFSFAGRLILHASFIEPVSGGGILFCGESGAGKTTQAENWRRYAGAKVINGDKALIGEENGVFYAYGLPLCGSSSDCKNARVPLECIVSLEKTPFNRVDVLSPSRAFVAVYKNCFLNRWNRCEAEKAGDTAAKLSGSLPVYILQNKADSQAVELLKRTLEDKK